ncbi:transporter substrate-binding domain-containing protein [Paracoccus alkenifer]|uniref:Polar amino acid transport system substrate-binding protein n=1 Tax=Paracoccus alkenifer TaxID=65735 RepID=A0A1H6KQ74_9RHOB|nr:transporter substrate-binding domain-containing protein [Paracoccus alkenifer]SEH77953.1 polar amino acid transport system substrate-binding protein [Paracoccus alkenifer]
MKPMGKYSALTVAMAFAAVGSAAQADAVWDRIAERGKIVCGAIPNDKIGSWHDRESGQWEGYEIELCRAIAADLSTEMGKEIVPEFRETSWKTIVLDLQASKIDLWPGMSATEERKKALSMIGPMYDLAFCGVNSKSFTEGATWESLNDPAVRIATVTGTSVETAFKEGAPNATHISLGEYAEVTLAVQSGRADVMGADILRCVNVRAAAPDAFGQITVPEPLKSMGSSAGILKDADQLAEWLAVWAEEKRASGAVTEIFMKAFEAAGVDIAELPPEVKF